jgi:hypothetical protein
MISGTISFVSLFEHIRHHSEVPHKSELAFLKFKTIYEQLVNQVGAIPGWYAWIHSEDGRPDIVYIGQSQSRKTANLQARLKEEFLDEFVALWATVWDPEIVVNTLDQKYHGKYTAPIKRSARKAGANYIVWFGREGVTDQELDVVEHALISKYNPPANKQTRIHSASFPDLFDEAVESLQHELTKIGGSCELTKARP